MRRVLIFITAVFWINASGQVKVELEGNEFSLPFPKEWLTKGSEKKNSFVFFNPKLAAPRPMISLYASSFQYPSNLSEFESALRVQKKNWLKKVEATAIAPLEFVNLKEYSSILIKLSFKSPQGEFSEWTHFEQCPNKEAVVLKALIPLALQPEFKTYERTFEQRICPL